MPPTSQNERSKPQEEQRNIQVRDSDSRLAAHFFGRTATTNFCNELIISSFIAVLRHPRRIRLQPANYFRLPIEGVCRKTLQHVNGNSDAKSAPEIFAKNYMSS